MVFCYSQKRKKIKMYYPQITVVRAHLDKSNTKVHLRNCYLLVVILLCSYFWARRMQALGATFVLFFFSVREMLCKTSMAPFLWYKMPFHQTLLILPVPAIQHLLQIFRGNIVYNSVSKREHFCNRVTVDNNPDAIQGIP